MANKKKTTPVIDEVVEDKQEVVSPAETVPSEPSFTKAALVASANLYYRVLYRLALADDRLYTKTEALEAVEAFKKKGN